MSGKRTHTMRNNKHKNNNQSASKRHKTRKIRFGSTHTKKVGRLYTRNMLPELFQTRINKLMAESNNKSEERAYIVKQTHIPKIQKKLNRDVSSYAKLTPSEFAHVKAKWIAQNVSHK